MAELTPRERLQPSLLDRLTDDEPLEKRESGNQRVLSPSRLRDSVRRDLTWLLNSTHMAALVDFERFPEIVRSTLNYGVPDLAGRTASTINVHALEQALRAVIIDYEPRLMRDTVRVEVVQDEEKMTHNRMIFVIEADLWSQPLPLKIFLRTNVDLETGDIVVSDSTQSG